MFKATFLDSSDFSARLVSSGGIVPSGTVTIKQNGVTNIAQYESVDVGVADNFPLLGGTKW